jgi:hypothetical protein
VFLGWLIEGIDELGVIANIGRHQKLRGVAVTLLDVASRIDIDGRVEVDRRVEADGRTGICWGMGGIGIEEIGGVYAFWVVELAGGCVEGKIGLGGGVRDELASFVVDCVQVGHGLVLRWP